VHAAPEEQRVVGARELRGPAHDLRFERERVADARRAQPVQVQRDLRVVEPAALPRERQRQQEQRRVAS
jgi:hypothetical protein